MAVKLATPHFSLKKFLPRKAMSLVICSEAVDPPQEVQR